MKTRDQIFKDIDERFRSSSKIPTDRSPVMTFFTDAVSKSLEDVYETVYFLKTPYVFTDTSGGDLDGIGYLVNLPRDSGESDMSYRNRLVNWNLINQSSNKAAIDNALTNLEYCSDAKYKEMTHGAGTGSIFIIPKDYEEKEQAEWEVRTKIESAVSPGTYISYIFPEIKPVEMIVCIRSEKGDLDFIKEKIESEFEEYINGIAPGDTLEVSALNRTGYDQGLVDFFSVLEVKIDGETKRELSITQDIKSKFILDSIFWVAE